MTEASLTGTSVSAGTREAAAKPHRVVVDVTDTGTIDGAVDPTRSPAETVQDLGPSRSLDADRWAELARAALLAEGVQHGLLGLTFTDPITMAELNQDHMGEEGPTDVLAFPLDADQQQRPSKPVSEVPVLLGDVVICAMVAATNAARRNRSLDDELALLVVHGVLHVMGLDHAEPQERSAMQHRERELLALLHDRSESAGPVGDVGNGHAGPTVRAPAVET